MAPRRPSSTRELCLTVFALAAGCAAAEDQVLWLTAIQPFTGGEWDAGISMRIGGEIMLEEINHNPDLLPGYQLKVVWQDGRCTEPVGTKIFLRNLFDRKYDVFAPGKALQELDADRDGTITTADTEQMGELWDSARVRPDPVGLLGSGCSVTAMRIVNIAHQARYPIVSNSAAFPDLSDRSSYPNFFRTTMPDTTFNAAWIAMARQLGHSSVSTVIGETALWGTMGSVLAEEAASQGVRLVGNDLTADIPRFYGMRVATDSQAMAATAAADVVRFRQRIVILLMFHTRNRLVLCELYKKHFRNAVYMPMGWFAFGWWSIPDTECSPGQVTAMAVGGISARTMFWRDDAATRLSCSASMTARKFEDEWFRRQGGGHGDLSKRPEGYAPASEAATTADAACMYATMLHEVLLNRGIPLSELTQRTPLGYANAIDALSKVDFEGVQGRVRFAPNSSDPKGSVILQQLQRSGGALELLDVASYSQATFDYLGKGDLVFQFPGERFPAGPAGATNISGDLAQFKVCTGSRVLETLSNQCVDCPNNTQLVQRADACLCVAGFYEAVGGCAPCPGGTISTSPGALQCAFCGPGKFAPPGSTSCSFCARGRFSNSSGLGTCNNCPPLQTTADIASQSAASCICESGSYRSADGDSCVWCPQNSRTRGLDSRNISYCLCAENMYMDLASGACRPCPAGSTTSGTGKTSVRSCLCAKGTYMQAGGTECLSCPEGMLCPKGSNEANTAYLSAASKNEEQEFPKLKAGFWSSTSEPMSVFACRSAHNCPGSRYPGDACAPHLIARACDFCEPGFHWDGVHCERCSPIETTNLLFPTIPLVLLLFSILAMYRLFGDPYAKWASWQNGITAVAFVTLNHFQQVDIMAGANLRLPTFIDDMFGTAEPTNNYSSLFKLDCLSMADFQSAILMQGVAPPVVLGTCLSIFFCSVLIAKVTQRKALMMDRDRLFNVFGSLMFTFFNAIAAAALLLFKCSRNPNGTRSLAADRSVICFDSADWQSVLITSIVLVLVYIVGVGGVLVRAVVVAPRHFVSVGFQMRWKFLFIKFRADAYWWSIALLTRNFLINLALVVATEGAAQMYAMMAVVMAYATLMLGVNPYRHRIANALEYMVSVTVTFIASLLLWHAERPHSSLDSAVNFSLAAMFVLPAILGAGCGLCLVLSGNRFPARQKQWQEAEKDFVDMVDVFAVLSVLSEEEGAEVLLCLADWDRWYLRQTMRAIHADVIERENPDGHLNRLVDTSLQQKVTEAIHEAMGLHDMVTRTITEARKSRRQLGSRLSSALGSRASTASSAVGRRTPPLGGRASSASSSLGRRTTTESAGGEKEGAAGRRAPLHNFVRSNI